MPHRHARDGAPRSAACPSPCASPGGWRRGRVGGPWERGGGARRCAGGRSPAPDNWRGADAESGPGTPRGAAPQSGSRGRGSPGPSRGPSRGGSPKGRAGLPAVGAPSVGRDPWGDRGPPPIGHSGRTAARGSRRSAAYTPARAGERGTPCGRCGMDSSLPSWPGLGERPSSGLLDLGRARGRLGSALPQDGTHCRHGRPGVPASGRQRVPEARGPLTRGCKAGALQRAPHHRRESDRVGEATRRGLPAEADAARRPAWSHVGARGPASLANVLGQGETVAPSPCATDEPCPRLPSQSISRHRDACTRSQAETSHQEHHGVIALAGGMVWMATL